MSETPRPLTVLTPSGTSPPTGKVSPPPLGPPSRPPVRVRVGGGYVYHHDTRKIETASTEEASSSDLRAALAEKDSKILRLQTRLAGMKDKLSELESVMKVAEEEHATEISGMHSRAEAAETAKRLALQEQEKAQHGLENLQMQQQAMFAQQRHQLDDAMAAGWKDGFHANANGVAQAQVETALADAQKRLADGERQRVQVAEELARSERQRVHELQTASAVQDDLRHRCHQWQSQAERAERALADSQVQCEALREALREAVVRNNGSSSSGSAGMPALIGPPTCAHDDAPFAAACASARDGARAAPSSDGQVPMAPMMSPAAAMLSPDLLDAFEAATAALSDVSPGKQLFLRVAALDPSLTSLELSHDPEIGRWPLERQAAALALLQGSPHVTKLNLSGLNLTDAVAPALRGVLEAPTGRLEVLSLEQNDFREAGLLELVEGLRTNTVLRELRLDGQKMPTSKRVEEALAAALDGAGATGLCKLGLTIRNDAARRSVDALRPFATEATIASDAADDGYDKSIRKLLGLPEPQPTSGLDDGIIDPFEAFFNEP
ncbi:tropomodulin 1 [Chrysochromulina tobinii]|uniref:Tropomodulin 1 n=1 Tax=Chrysochromulina tobinii TaxID=1460289 RepID=A0A0M0J6P3_9EUKA|nr:tropomodulin 1 [Chrysochromulina tobinii]|eukprot:KOO22281.1 tropomodulin 1 [Chrysochromulina sp. CCMP291]